MEICEISMNNLLRGGDIDHLEFLDRADSLKALGKNVLITKMPRFDNLSELLARYTKEPIAIALSIGLLNELFKEKWTEDIPGGILESFGRTFQNKTRLYVSPWLTSKSGIQSRPEPSAPQDSTCTFTSTSWPTNWVWTSPSSTNTCCATRRGHPAHDRRGR